MNIGVGAVGMILESFLVRAGLAGVGVALAAALDGRATVWLPDGVRTAPVVDLVVPESQIVSWWDTVIDAGGRSGSSARVTGRADVAGPRGRPGRDWPRRA